MKKLLLLFVPGMLVLTSFGPSATVETINYEVLLDGRPIGTYSVSRKDVNGTSNYRIETNTAAGLIRREEYRSVMLSSFKQSKMMFSELKTWLNQKLEFDLSLKWNGEQYVRREGDRLEDLGHELVTYSSACVYFSEPKDRSTLFYEKYGRELDVVPLGTQRYMVTLPDACKEQYTYHNGKVVQVELIRSFTTITLRLKP